MIPPISFGTLFFIFLSSRIDYENFKILAVSPEIVEKMESDHGLITETMMESISIHLNWDEGSGMR